MKKLKPYVAIVLDNTTERSGIIGAIACNKKDLIEKLNNEHHKVYTVLAKKQAEKIQSLNKSEHIQMCDKLAPYSCDWFEVYRYTQYEMMLIIMEQFKALEHHIKSIELAKKANLTECLLQR